MALDSFLSPSEAASIRGEFQNLDATIGELNDHPVVTFTRRDQTTIGPITCISIKRDRQRQEQSIGGGTAFSGLEVSGTLKAFADQFTAPVQPGDRFDWEGQTCRVTQGPAPKWYGATVTVTFVLEVGN